MITKQMLEQAGFKETYYPDQTEKRPFLTKHTLAMHMPYIKANVVDEEYVCAEDKAIVAVTPDGFVQIVIGDNYMENDIAMDSEEGIAMLKDAGVVV